jgi:predicted HicB family RNase H-like nuclease
MTTQRYRGGRSSKGERLQLISRVATPIGEAVRTQAEERGMSMNDFIAAVLAREVGMPDLAPLSTIQPQRQELPISDAA